MVSTIDHQIIKAKIVTVLQGNSTIFETPPTTAGSKFRIIQVGAPDFYNISELPMPSCYVIADERIIEEHKRVAPHSVGIAFGDEITWRYLIVFVVTEKDSIRVEERLDNFQKEIIQTVLGNVKFGDVSSITSNTVLDDSWPEKVMVLNPNMLGKEQQGRIIQLWCKKTIS